MWPEGFFVRHSDPKLLSSKRILQKRVFHDYLLLPFNPSLSFLPLVVPYETPPYFSFDSIPRWLRGELLTYDKCPHNWGSRHVLGSCKSPCLFRSPSFTVHEPHYSILLRLTTLLYLSPGCRRCDVE